MNPSSDILQQSVSTSNLDINQATLKPESLYEKLPLSDVHLQQSIHISKIDINQATIKPESLKPLNEIGPKADNEMDIDVKAAAVMCQYLYDCHDINQKNKPLIELLDGWKPMNDSEVDKLVGPGFHLRLRDDSSGFSSMLFQKYAGGIQYYAYCTEGTEMTSINDWTNNISQSLLFGISRQYSYSVDNAKQINAAVGNKAVLWFIGHSLGGGLASNNSLVTGRHAITFNAAGLNINRVTYTLLWNNWKDLFHPTQRTQRVHAFVIEGEILNSVTRWIGQSAYGNKKYLKLNQSGIGMVDKHSMTVILDHLGIKHN